MATIRNILLTGYWPPTNEMLRQFSSKAAQNPSVWKGNNWEGRGYDIHAFFPEFPEGSWPIGEGDFTVDYAATSADWARITDLIQPRAIITFSRGYPGRLWEIELRQRNLTTWISDYNGHQPIPSPPDRSFPPEAARPSTLPTQLIGHRVREAFPELTVYSDFVDYGGGFLSEFIAYHGVWYQASHSAHCYAAGHVHVGMDVAIDVAVRATEVTLRALLDYLQLFDV